ncbi:hypothetical protein GCM10009760_28690 [Kitasatospora kazusensis]|uniref:DUF2568 domain-containing protein n=1 Tax=Kitasatospora kazusensis TaxID=407974 RepID=A0ABN2ZJ03_9ACTN
MSSTGTELTVQAAPADRTRQAEPGTPGTPAAPGSRADGADQAVATPPAAADLRIPLWFFCFEGALAGAFDVLKAFPAAWPVLVLLIAVNITVSLTMMRGRLKLAKALWRGKETRKIVIGLLVLRLGSHLALKAVGLGITSTLGHLVFALVMSGVTVAVLAFSQRMALRALAR